MEAGPRLVGQLGDPLGPQHRWEGEEHAWQALGRHNWDSVMRTLPQETWAPWMAMIGRTTTPGSGRTWAV